MNVETPSSCCTSPAQASTEIIPLPTLNYYMNADLLIALICVSILALALTMWIIIDHRCLKTRKTTTNMFGMSSQPAQRPSDNMQTTLRLGKDTLVANPWYPPSRLLPMASSLNGQPFSLEPSREFVPVLQSIFESPELFTHVPQKRRHRDRIRRNGINQKSTISKEHSLDCYGEKRLVENPIYQSPSSPDVRPTTKRSENRPSNNDDLNNKDITLSYPQIFIHRENDNSLYKLTWLTSPVALTTTASVERNESRSASVPNLHSLHQMELRLTQTLPCKKHVSKIRLNRPNCTYGTPDLTTLYQNSIKFARQRLTKRAAASGSSRKRLYHSREFKRLRNHRKIHKRATKLHQKYKNDAINIIEAENVRNLVSKYGVDRQPSDNRTRNSTSSSSSSPYFDVKSDTNWSTITAATWQYKPNFAHPTTPPHPVNFSPVDFRIKTSASNSRAAPVNVQPLTRNPSMKGLVGSDTTNDGSSISGCCNSSHSRRLMSSPISTASSAMIQVFDDCRPSYVGQFVAEGSCIPMRHLRKTGRNISHSTSALEYTKHEHFVKPKTAEVTRRVPVCHSDIQPLPEHVLFGSYTPNEQQQARVSICKSGLKNDNSFLWDNFPFQWADRPCNSIKTYNKSMNENNATLEWDDDDVFADCDENEEEINVEGSTQFWV